MMRAKHTVMNALRTAAMTLVALSALSAADAQNPNLMLLVRDGSFETTISDNNWGSNPATWYARQFFGGGFWEVVSGSIDIARQPGMAPHLNQFVDLNGDGPGAIRQVIGDLSEGTYSLQFWMGAYLADENGSTDNLPVGEQVGMWVRVTDISDNLIWERRAVWTYDGTNNGTFDLFTYDGDDAIVIPVTGDYYLYFVSDYVGNPDANIPRYFGPRIDAVSEPASMLALSAGLAGLLGLRRRRARG